MDRIKLACFLFCITALVHSELVSVDPTKKVQAPKPVSSVNPPNAGAVGDSKTQSVILKPAFKAIQGYTARFINKQIIPPYISKQSVQAFQEKLGEEFEQEINKANPNLHGKVIQVEKKAIQASSQLKKKQSKYQAEIMNPAKAQTSQTSSNKASTAKPAPIYPNYAQNFAKWIQIFQPKNLNPNIPTPKQDQDIKTDKDVQVNCKVDADCVGKFPQLSKQKTVKCDAKLNKCVCN